MRTIRYRRAGGHRTSHISLVSDRNPRPYLTSDSGPRSIGPTPKPMTNRLKPSVTMSRELWNSFDLLWISRYTSHAYQGSTPGEILTGMI